MTRDTFRVNRSLLRHPKTLHLARLTGSTRHRAIGIVCELIAHIDEYGADDGRISVKEPRDLDHAMEWRPGLTEALIEAGFIDWYDIGPWLHDWEEQA